MFRQYSKTPEKTVWQFFRGFFFRHKERLVIFRSLLALAALALVVLILLLLLALAVLVLLVLVLIVVLVLVIVRHSNHLHNKQYARIFSF